ncbi:hypothetical protein MOQ_003266, partial [Trypanosoma cruzi marinkellei]
MKPTRICRCWNVRQLFFFFFLLVISRGQCTVTNFFFLRCSCVCVCLFYCLLLFVMVVMRPVVVSCQLASTTTT